MLVVVIVLKLPWRWSVVFVNAVALIQHIVTPFPLAPQVPALCEKPRSSLAGFSYKCGKGWRLPTMSLATVRFKK